MNRLTQLVTTAMYYYDLIEIVPLAPNKSTELVVTTPFTHVLHGCLENDVIRLQDIMCMFSFKWLGQGYILCSYNKELNWGLKWVKDPYKYGVGTYFTYNFKP